MENKDISGFIYNKLENIRNKNNDKLSSISNEFIFAYGPYMCIIPGFERDVDEIAKENRLMKLLQYGAYLYRKITSSISYHDAKELIRDFIMTVDSNFDGIEKDCLIKFGKKYLQIIRDEQKNMNNLESFMTCAAPIVPYSNTIQRKDLMEAEEDYRIDIAPKLTEIIKEKINIDDYLFSMLMDNLNVILHWAHIVPILNNNDNSFDLTKLDKLVYSMHQIPKEVKIYYCLAIVNYHKIPPLVFNRYLSFFNDFCDVAKMYSSASFESLIEEHSQNINLSAAMEALTDDPQLDIKAKNAVQNIIDSHSSYADMKEKAQNDNGKYDLDKIRSFISINRYIKFEEFPNRLFISTIEKYNIINISYMDSNMQFIEMSNDKMVIPFTDIRDNRPKIIVLDAYTNKITMYDNYVGLF